MNYRQARGFLRKETEKKNSRGKLHYGGKMQPGKKRGSNMHLAKNKVVRGKVNVGGKRPELSNVQTTKGNPRRPEERELAEALRGGWPRKIRGCAVGEKESKINRELRRENAKW